jgi:transposase
VQFLVSRAWLSSDWCLKEFNLACRLNKRLFGLLIDDIPIGDLPATGRPSYHPSVLLKLYIYGYLNRIQSSRRLEREAGRDVRGHVAAGSART